MPPDGPCSMIWVSGLGLRVGSLGPVVDLPPCVPLQPAQVRGCLHDRDVQLLGLAAGVGMEQMWAWSLSQLMFRVCRQGAEGFVA